MSIRAILVGASGGTASDGAIDLASRLALRVGAHLQRYHVKSDPSSLMWTAPEVASRIWSARARPLAPPMSAVSPVRSLLAAGPPGDLQHDRAAPVRRRALPLSGCLPSWRAGCRATSETGPACPPTSAPRQPTFRSTAPIGRPTVSDNHRLRRRSRGSNLAPRSVGRGSLGGGRGAIAAGWWSWHPGLISRDASRVQWRSTADRRR